jgi:hypothetical protein
MTEKRDTYGDLLAESFAARSNGTVPTETIKANIGTPQLGGVLNQAGVSQRDANLADLSVIALFVAQHAP